MNLWKPTALVAIGALTVVTGYRTHVGFSVPNAEAGNQPNMEAAAAKLKEARALLEKAEHNKGGHRAKAIEFTDKAIVEVDKGIAFADK